MTKKIDNEEWGNIELPGLSDEKLYSTNWNHVAAGKERAANPNWQKKNSAKYSDVNWITANANKNKQLAKDPKWLAKNSEKNKRITNTSKWIEANKQGQAKKKLKSEFLKATDPEAYRKFCGVKDKHDSDTIEKMKAKAKARWANKKKVSCQGVIYDSIYAAGEALGIHKDTVSYRIKHKPKEYFYID